MGPTLCGQGKALLIGGYQPRLHIRIPWGESHGELYQVPTWSPTSHQLRLTLWGRPGNYNFDNLGSPTP